MADEARDNYKEGQGLLKEHKTLAGCFALAAAIVDRIRQPGPPALYSLLPMVMIVEPAK
jgi:hypothetical protein